MIQLSPRTIDAATGEILSGDSEEARVLLNRAERAIWAGEPLIDLAITLVAAAQRALESAHTVPEAKDVRDKLVSLQTYFSKQRAGLVNSNLVVAQRLRTERVLGRMIPEQFPWGGDGGDGNSKMSLRHLGILPHQSAIWQREIKYCPDDEDFEVWVNENLETQEFTTAGFLRDHQEFATPEQTPPLPDGIYSLIYADPPWQYEFAESNTREIENNYPTMPLQDICGLPISALAADDSVLLLWATSPKLQEAMQIIEAWGFTYRTCAVWDKEIIGMGYYWRQRHELLLLASRGSLPVPEPANRPDSIFVERRSKHSQKPALVYSMIERMYPTAAKIELFARNEREGWDRWGNQA